MMPRIRTSPADHAGQAYSASARAPRARSRHWVLRSIQNAATPLVELLVAGPTAEPAVTLSGVLAPFRNSCRAAPNAFHRANPSRRAPIAHTTRHRTRTVARALTELKYK